MAGCGTYVVRRNVARKLARESHNVPLQMFSASSELVGSGRSFFRQHSEHTSRLLQDVFETRRKRQMTGPESPSLAKFHFSTEATCFPT
jgi:hypothetical protein